MRGYERTTWDAESVAMLRRLVGEGKTAAQIAGELGNGITANAVMGKCSRMRLRLGGSRGALAPAMHQADREIAERRGVRREPVSMPAIVALVPMPTPPPEIKPIVVLDDDPGGRPTLLTVRNGQCRWPMWGDPDDEPRHVCGAACDPGKAYCDEHARLGTLPRNGRTL